MNTNISETQDNQNEKTASTDGKKFVRRRARNKMSRVQRVGVTSDQRNNGNEVSNVQDDFASGEAEEVHNTEAEVVVRSLNDLNMVERVELLNAYKSIHSKLPEVKASSWILTILKAEYQSWVDSKMAELFGESSPSQSQFSDSEIVALKALAQTVISRKQASPSPSPSPQPQPQRKAAPAPRSNYEKSSVQSEEYIRAQNDFLTQLAKMERDGPEF